MRWKERLEWDEGSQEKKVKEGRGNWGEHSIETNPECGETWHRKEPGLSWGR